eukprot:Blabericola_migrator_1__5034@NODE_260_length_10712_cov_94_884922_g218_i0_p2_GENE_NODE_260_length_10712_cov_94_884922_g218_i0NODE_260_length_10712_cov_94_884922_g218_i0_p2_ORF_typecomplete_len555_score116_85PID/PF00640_23/6_3e03PID/PF00640_23/0_001PID/PF00640_23/4_1e03Baculo_PEP_N/PF04512_12/0_067_NODE_260_length_10712_cov_94_884922_g218_i032494913
MNWLPILEKDLPVISGDTKVVQVIVVDETLSTVQWICNVVYKEQHHLIHFKGFDKTPSKGLLHSYDCAKCGGCVDLTTLYCLSTQLRYSVSCYTAGSQIWILAANKHAAILRLDDQALVFVDLDEIVQLLKVPIKDCTHLQRLLISEQKGVSCAAISPNFSFKSVVERPVIWGRLDGGIWIYQFPCHVTVEDKMSRTETTLLCQERHPVLNLVYQNEILMWSTTEGTKMFHLSRGQKIALIPNEMSEVSFIACHSYDLQTVGIITSNLDVKTVHLSVSEANQYTARIVSTVGSCCTRRRQMATAVRLTEVLGYISLPETWQVACRKALSKEWSFMRQSDACARCVKAFRTVRHDVVIACMAQRDGKPHLAFLSPAGHLLQHREVAEGYNIRHNISWDGPSVPLYVSSSSVVLFDVDASPSEHWAEHGVPLPVSAEQVEKSVNHFLIGAEKQEVWELPQLFHLVDALQIIVCWMEAQERDVMPFLESFLAVFVKRSVEIPTGVKQALKNILTIIFHSNDLAFDSRIGLCKSYFDKIASSETHHSFPVWDCLGFGQ